MKEITKMSRLTNQLEKMFRLLNTDFFDGVLDMPVITVVPSSRSYAHYTPWDAWQSGDTYRREINVASATLNRPLEAICGSLLHEMVHMYNDTVLNEQDCSRNGTYHNRLFKEQAEAHGLVCTKTDTYGWSRTAPSDDLMDWLLLHDELREIEMCRINPALTSVGIGTHAASGGLPVRTTTRSNSRRYVCPGCRAVVRATRSVNVLCGDCMAAMIES